MEKPTQAKLLASGDAQSLPCRSNAPRGSVMAIALSVAAPVPSFPLGQTCSDAWWTERAGRLTRRAHTKHASIGLCLEKRRCRSRACRSKIRLDAEFAPSMDSSPAEEASALEFLAAAAWERAR